MNATQEKLETATNGTAPVTEKVASAAHDAVDSAAARAEKVERNVRNGAAEAGETLEQSQEAAVARIDESIKSLETFMKRRPVAAAGIAFAIGAVTTSLLRR